MSVCVFVSARMRWHECICASAGVFHVDPQFASSLRECVPLRAYFLIDITANRWSHYSQVQPGACIHFSYANATAFAMRSHERLGSCFLFALRSINHHFASVRQELYAYAVAVRRTTNGGVYSCSPTQARIGTHTHTNSHISLTSHLDGGEHR